jgi:hypothetical protein
MRTIAEVCDQLAYHPATATSAAQHDHVRTTLMSVVSALWGTVPDGPEKTLAMRALQQCGMYCNLAIAVGQPLAEPGTEAVARVVPPRCVVICGSRMTFNAWRKEHSESTAIYGTGESLRGLRGPVKVIRLRGWSERPDLERIEQQLAVIAATSSKP